MKNYNVKNIIIALGIVLTFANCTSDDNLEEQSKTGVEDFSVADLEKLHGGSEKSWKLTEVILPEEYIDNPNLMNNACVADDIYTFKASTTNESVENVTVDLGDTRCFETVSDAEQFEAKLLYVPYKLNNVNVVETTLILTYSSIKNTANNGTYKSSMIDSYRLVELTEDRMVFSNATYVGEYIFGYVFEKVTD
jgi:hypothetical protein